VQELEPAPAGRVGSRLPARLAEFACTAWRSNRQPAGSAGAVADRLLDFLTGPGSRRSAPPAPAPVGPAERIASSGPPSTPPRRRPRHRRGRQGRAVEPAPPRALRRDLTGLVLADWLGLPGLARRPGGPAGAEYRLPAAGRAAEVGHLGRRPLAAPGGSAVVVREVTAQKAERDSAGCTVGDERPGAVRLSAKTSRPVHVHQPAVLHGPGQGPGPDPGGAPTSTCSSRHRRARRQADARVRETGEVVEYIEEHATAQCPPGCRCRLFRAPARPGPRPRAVLLPRAPGARARRRPGVTGVQGAFWDVTDRRRAEAELTGMNAEWVG